MASQDVRILEIRGETLLVSSGESSACGGCRSKSTCGTGGGAVHEIRIAHAQLDRLRTQEIVNITLPTSQVLHAAGKAYLPPLFGLLLGVVIAAGATSAAGDNDTIALIGGLFGMCVGLAISRKLGRNRRFVHSVARAGRNASIGDGCGK